MAGMTLEWQVFLRGIEKRIEDIERDFGNMIIGESQEYRLALIFLRGQLDAFEEVRDYIKEEMK